MNDNQFRVIIVGAGPVGLYMAHTLAAANIEFIILEQQPSVVNYFGAMIFTWPHTVRLLDQIGLYEPAKRSAVAIHAKKRIFGGDGSVLTTSGFWDRMHENHGYPFLPILRSDVVKILYENMPGRDTNVRTNAEVVDINVYADRVHVHLKDGSVEKGSIVVGADGVHSKTRTIMQRLTGDPSAASIDESPMVSSFHGIVGRAPNDFAGMEEGVFFESRGGEAAVQCTATKDTVYFATLKLLPEPTKGRRKYTWEDMEEHAASVSEVWVAPGVRFGDLWAKTDKPVARMLNQEEGFVDRWHHDRVVLLGDAAHKTTSINGLGLTCGLHSAAALANELQSLLAANKFPDTSSLTQAFARYERERRGEARQIWKRGFTMIREVTRKSWVNWFWDSYILPWIDTETIARGLLVSVMLIRKGQTLAYVPFDGKYGTVPWLRRAGTT
ncbi:hypothetical protein F5X99DRAFT_410687 [Biscogniauxia marginata]|nr:hypothetical protein F5X99DRAFT_410687 [Biscogniauxia marginata]